MFVTLDTYLNDEDKGIFSLLKGMVVALAIYRSDKYRGVLMLGAFMDLV